MPTFITFSEVPLPAGRTVLYRALRDDADFPFVAIGAGAAYEVVHEDGDPDGEGGATLIDPFEVAPDDDERFMREWRAARDARAAHHGYLGTRLHRAVGPAGFRFVDVARWSSPLMYARASREVTPPSFASRPALYQPITVAP